MTFRPHKTLIIVPRQRNRVSVYTAPYTVMLVTYYAPGCFRVDQKVGERRTYDAAKALMSHFKEPSC